MKKTLKTKNQKNGVAPRLKRSFQSRVYKGPAEPSSSVNKALPQHPHSNPETTLVLPLKNAYKAINSSINSFKPVMLTDFEIFCKGLLEHFETIDLDHIFDNQLPRLYLDDRDLHCLNLRLIERTSGCINKDKVLHAYLHCHANVVDSI